MRDGAKKHFRAQGCKNSVFGIRCFCLLLKTGGFDEEMAKMTIYILPITARGFAPHTPETDKKDENDKNHSSKNTVFQKHRFHHPE